ncbi:MAG: hypothetical protein AAF591_15080 [Verrucomicrobiota bacterium]
MKLANNSRGTGIAFAAAVLCATAVMLAGCGGGGGEAGDEGGNGGGDASGGGDSATASSSAGGDGKMVLTTDIPPQKIEGTPKAIKVPVLEPAPKEAPKLAVPEGTVLLSKGKPVTSSDDFPIIGEVELITDGDKDAGEGYFVELMDGLQWVQIDLEESADIYAIWIWHFHSQARAYHDVVVQISDDPEFASGVTTLFNNDYDASTEFGKGGDKPYVETRFGKVIDAGGTKGRYVRLYSAGNTSNSANHYIEVEVFGKPAA